jgi:hypothetical protein
MSACASFARASSAQIHGRFPAIHATNHSIDRCALFIVAVEIYSSLHRNKRTLLETNIDLLNTFLAFNVAASALTLIAFAAMREPASDGLKKAKAKLSAAHIAGMGGAATSLVLLASVAHLFQ